jgi:hypothetical protein
MLCVTESQQCRNKTMLTADIHNKVVAKSMIELPGIDD